MDNKKNNYDILSKNDIEKIRKAYNNYNIAENYLIFEVNNIIKQEGISKNKAISKILKIVNI